MITKIKNKLERFVDYILSISNKDSNREIILKVLSVLFLLHITLSIIISLFGLLTLLLSDLKVFGGLCLIGVIFFAIKPNKLIKLKKKLKKKLKE